MAQHRTRQQKILAKLKRQAQVNEGGMLYSHKVNIIEKSQNKDSFYHPELSLPVKSVFSDLTKTFAITILALVLQAGLSIFLNNGGWKTVNDLWLSKLI